MFHLLRHHGYDENHIIVVTEDDIFGKGLFGEKTTEKVVKRLTAKEDVNLYEEIPSHYRLSDITQQDILDIIAGKKSERLPYVIESNEEDNVLIYWSGHGTKDGSLLWHGKDSPDIESSRKGLFDASMMTTALNSMRSNIFTKR